MSPSSKPLPHPLKTYLRYTPGEPTGDAQQSSPGDPIYHSIGPDAGKGIHKEITDVNQYDPRYSRGRSGSQLAEYGDAVPGVYSIGNGKAVYSNAKDGQCSVYYNTGADSGYGNGSVTGSRPSVSSNYDSPSVYYNDSLYNQSLAGYSEGYDTNYWMVQESPLSKAPRWCQDNEFSWGCKFEDAVSIVLHIIIRVRN